MADKATRVKRLLESARVHLECGSAWIAAAGFVEVLGYIADLEAEVERLSTPDIFGYDDCVMLELEEEMYGYQPGDTFERWANRSLGWFRYEVGDTPDGDDCPAIARICAYSRHGVGWVEVDAQTESEAIVQAREAAEAAERSE